MSIPVSYSDPEEEFGSIIYQDPQLQTLIDAEDREIDLSDDDAVIIEPDLPPINENNPDFWSDR